MTNPDPMQTGAYELGKRKGRKRKFVSRHPDGRPHQKSPYTREQEARSVALEARQRVFGLNKTDADRQEAGSVLGRLLITGEISRRQFDAAFAYEDARGKYLAALMVRPQRSAGDLNRSPGHDSSEGDEPTYVRWSSQAVKRYQAMRRRILTCGDPFAQMVLDGCIEGRDMLTTSRGNLGTLRMALNAVARVALTEESAA
jgi:hypothetical protein